MFCVKHARPLARTLVRAWPNSFPRLQTAARFERFNSYEFLRPSIDEIVARYMVVFGSETPGCEESDDEHADGDNNVADVAGPEAFAATAE